MLLQVSSCHNCSSVGHQTFVQYSDYNLFQLHWFWHKESPYKQSLKIIMINNPVSNIYIKMHLFRGYSLDQSFCFVWLLVRDQHLVAQPGFSAFHPLLL